MVIAKTASRNVTIDMTVHRMYRDHVNCLKWIRGVVGNKVHILSSIHGSAEIKQFLCDFFGNSIYLCTIYFWRHKIRSYIIITISMKTTTDGDVEMDGGNDKMNTRLTLTPLMMVTYW